MIQSPTKRILKEETTLVTGTTPTEEISGQKIEDPQKETTRNLKKGSLGIGTLLVTIVPEEAMTPRTDIPEVTEEIMKPGIDTLEVVTADPETNLMKTDLCPEIETTILTKTTQEDMIDPEGHMIDQNPLISQETGTEVTLITGVLIGMDMSKKIGPTAEIEETGPTAEIEETTLRDMEELGPDPLDPPLGTLAEDMTDQEEDTDLPLEVARMTETAATLEVVRMTETAATLETDPDLEEGETTEEVTAGTIG